MGSFEVNVDENENEKIDVGAHENVINEEELNESKMPNNRAGKYSLLVWNFFEKLVLHSDGKVRCKCKYCLKDYVGDDNKNETSTLQRHTRKCGVY